jgi:hypothetical protein
VLIGVNPCLTESYLKKQTQFIKGKDVVKLILTMVYGDFGGPRQRENKANQSQFDIFWRVFTKHGGRAEKNRSGRLPIYRMKSFFLVLPVSLW